MDEELLRRVHEDLVELTGDLNAEVAFGCEGRARINSIVNFIDRRMSMLREAMGWQTESEKLAAVLMARRDPSICGIGRGEAVASSDQEDGR